ncbi:PREDICTED: peptidyl-prolyl cis-trans isomerase FKBP15-3-like isoform X2 [Camelina sativa]|uniref:peptidylprolyl isomerase n=1 Tax=Camelina sativa TaxID=90675 RepID=A0ABM0TBL8_CAMSA|nr:PREDICTED: peptidyl-prolyl cis-trans isomerase FKBP15-3-like isoform X2 [Camelina sativa]
MDKIRNLFVREGRCYAQANIEGKDIADKVLELNGSVMGGRKLSVQVLCRPRINTTHMRRHYQWPLPDPDSSTSDASILEIRSESSKTPDKPVEKKRKLSKEEATATLKSKTIPTLVEKQTPDLAGLVVYDICMGHGKKADPGKWVTVHYTAKLHENGRIYYSTCGGYPHKFRVGLGHVFPGLDYGILGMRVGGKRKLTIPPALGHGVERFRDTITPEAWLVFEVELLSLK